jgi:selenocysteine lyase/cysteine desulfurase
MEFNRRQWMTTLTAGLAWSASACQKSPASGTKSDEAPSAPLRSAAGDVDWHAVRGLFPLKTNRTHLASFLLVSHPKPVSAAIQHFREKIDEDPTWIERAAFSDSEGHPYSAVKRALADYVGGDPEEFCLTSNTTTALAMAYHGLRIRKDQEILTTEHDHYSHHESIRFAAARSGCGVRYTTLYDRPASANAAEMADRIGAAIRPATRAVGVTWVHSSTGVKIPVAAIADAVARANKGRALADRRMLIVDGVHGFANQDVDVARLGCDFFATGTHKWLFGPRGTGFLWGRKDAWPELRPTIPTFDPEAPEPWDAWKDRRSLPPTKASFISPGGFLAFEHLLAIPAAVELHRSIGRDHIAARIRELNSAFREGVGKIPGVTLHTPVDPEASAGISCFEVKGLKPDEVEMKLANGNFVTNSSPYKISYPRVAAGIMNFPEEIDGVLRAIRAMAG